MKIEEIKELMKEMAETGVAELAYEEGGVSLHLCTKDAPLRVVSYAEPMNLMQGQPTPAGAASAGTLSAKAGVDSAAQTEKAAASAEVENSAAGETVAAADKSAGTAKAEGKIVTSPLVGTFYASAAPDEPPCVKEGDRVKKGQVLGIIEAMKLMNEVESEFDGTVAEILVENEQVVEYGQPLFRIV